MTITVKTPAQTTALTTLERLKEDLGIVSTTDDDALLTRMIDRATSRAEACTNRVFSRAQYTETFEGLGRTDALLNRVPIFLLTEVRFADDVVEFTDFSVSDPDAGIIVRVVPFTSTEPRSIDLTIHVRPDRGQEDWAVDYWAGWLLPGDDFNTTALAFVEADKSLVLSTGKWPLLVAADRISISGSGSNDGAFTIAARDSDTKITVIETVADESAGATIAVTVQNLPADIEDAALAIAKNIWLSRKDNPLQTSLRIGDFAETRGAARIGESELARWKLF